MPSNGANGASATNPLDPHGAFDTILVLDFGSQYSHLITRRLRELNVYSEMLPCTTRLADMSWRPKGVILSGGPYSVYEQGAPHVDPALFNKALEPHLEVPVLGICYGLQEMAEHPEYSGKNVLRSEKREYGHASLKIERHAGKAGHVDELFKGMGDELVVWMSHGDGLANLPVGFLPVAATANAPFAGVAHETKPYYGIQFHPEVTHTARGAEIIKNFAVSICQARQDWSMEEFRDKEVAKIRKLVGEHGQVIGAVSGGVDSSVAAKLMQEAIGDRFHAVLVDNGLMRQNEAQDVKSLLAEHMGINLTVVDAGERFLRELSGVTEPEQKRKIIGKNFIDVFEKVSEDLMVQARGSSRDGPVEWLLQGTLYPDVIESISFKGPSATIKTHHNVGGLPDRLKLKLIEPLRELFKDEVRVLGVKLGIPEELVWRHPFPGPGLGVRILGEVNAGQLHILRQADSIFIEEIRKAGLYREISQALVGLLPVKAVGVMGDRREWAQVVALRAVVTTDFMTAKAYHFKPEFLDHISSRIVNEVDGVVRVFQDITSKPPGTIELE